MFVWNTALTPENISGPITWPRWSKRGANTQGPWAPFPALAARQAGAGFWGCMVAFVEFKQLPAFVASVAKTYFNATQTQPGINPVAAAAGAGLKIGP